MLEQDGEFEYLGAAASLSDALDAVREAPARRSAGGSKRRPEADLSICFRCEKHRARCYPVLWINELAEIDCFRALQLGARGILKKIGGDRVP